MHKIILASGSPRRQALLDMIHIPYEIVVSNIDENLIDEVSPYELVKSLSNKKALWVNEQVLEPAIIIAADTAVSLQEEIMGKPSNPDDAFNMLKKLQGKQHTVYTGVTIVYKDTDQFEVHSFVNDTRVFMRPLSDIEIYDYIHTGEPFDKAGGYGIQGEGALLIEKIDGDYYTVVGLPLVKVFEALRSLGIAK